MLEGRADLQEGVLILLNHNLRAMLHAGHRFMGQFLARPKRHSCQVVNYNYLIIIHVIITIINRVSLGVTTLLTMSTQTSGINAQLPPVSYTKAIDVWTGVSLKYTIHTLTIHLSSGYTARKVCVRHANRTARKVCVRVRECACEWRTHH